MVVEKLKGNTLRRDWVPLEDISPQLPLAVIASEDGRFCVHWGVDWGAVREAVKEGGGLSGLRGASTIPMQTAKNLYLGNGRSYVRKAFEVPLAYVMSALWPKQRMMEVYLNVAQFGPGIFGAEAASRYYFHKSAADLTRARGGAARCRAAQSALQQSGQAKPARCSSSPGRSSAGCRSWRSARVASCRRDKPAFIAIGPWPRPRIATIRAGSKARRGPLTGFAPWLYPKEKPRA